MKRRLLRSSALPVLAWWALPAGAWIDRFKAAGSDPSAVLLIDNDGRDTVFARYPKS